nr:hypothetical protein [Tanacetum cinerariifolium]
MSSEISIPATSRPGMHGFVPGEVINVGTFLFQRTRIGKQKLDNKCCWYGKKFDESEREWGGRGKAGHDNLHDENVGETPSNINLNKGTSYANLFTSALAMKSLNFRTLFTPAKNGIDVVVSVESIRAINERFANTVYSFFLGKWVAYPVVANYVWNTWGKYGLVKSMLNSSSGIFSFQFSFIDDLNAVHENGALAMKSLNFRTLFTPAKNGIDVVVPVESIRAINERFTNTVYSFFLGKRVAYPVVANYVWNTWGRSRYARALTEVRADVGLKDNIVVAMPKLVEEGLYTCSVCVKYKWKRPTCTCCKVFSHVHDECLKNTDSDVVKNMKKPSQAPRGVSVGPKKDVDAEPTIEVSNSNPFDVLNSIKNYVDLVTNAETSNMASNKAKSGRSSSWNVKVSSITTMPIFDKIDEYEKLIIDGKVSLVDDEGKPLKKIAYSDDHDSEDDVELVHNDMAHFMASERVGFGTNILFGTETLYPLVDDEGKPLKKIAYSDDHDSEDDVESVHNDMAHFMASERVGFGTNVVFGQEVPDTIQSICDNLANIVRGCKKK